jgi:hypothetical protein
MPEDSFDELKVKAADEDPTLRMLHELAHRIDHLEQAFSGGGTSSSGGSRSGGRVTIVDSEGTVIGSGTVDPSSGVVRTDIVRTTVVTKQSSSGRWSVAGSGAGDISDAVSTGAPGQGTPTMGTIGTPFYINPDTFNFRPTQDNWQETDCVKIVFAYGSPYISPMRIQVGVRVGAPRQLANGHSVSVREAQLNSANAATVAATEIIALLDEAALDPSGIQPRFTGFMGGALLANGEGYRVNGCFPG